MSASPSAIPEVVCPGEDLRGSGFRTHYAKTGREKEHQFLLLLRRQRASRSYDFSKVTHGRILA